MFFFICFRLEGCCWQSLRNGASSGSMRMTLTADLQPRSDTGVINSSPVVTMTPVVRLLAGCQHSLRIPGTSTSMHWIADLGKSKRNI